MDPANGNTDELLERAGRGDAAAQGELLACHRLRLRQMVAVRMDRRLAARLDPSDVVQEALLEASRHLADYLRQRPLPFYLWLRRLTWEHLVAASRRHLQAHKRSVRREEPHDAGLSDQSAQALVDRLVASGTTPSGQFARAELQERVQSALAGLSAPDREV